MSWAHVKRALESELRGLDKFVLIVLANHCNDQDGHPKRGLAWPSVTTLVKEAGISRATVNRVLNRLEADGYLVREHHGTRSTHYRLSVSEGDTNARARKVNVSQGDTNAIVSQTETEVSHSETSSVSERDTNLLMNPVRRESSPQRELSSSFSALGSGEPDPTRASRISALAPGNGVKSADADNEEKRCKLRETRRQQAIDLGMSPKQIDGMDANQLSLAILDARLKMSSDVLTSDTESVAHCQGP